jgi:hypothetical protein
MGYAICDGLIIGGVIFLLVMACVVIGTMADRRAPKP